jgi:N-acetyl-1-D-myo-inositol-2-amino-2-deoxy-alpha-D-glucopyranoside deacetylase
MRQLGVEDVRLLGYRDSGMAGSPFAEHPRAFLRASIEDAAGEIVPHIRAIQPHAIVTFGPEGLYGHPDHIHLHHVMLHAVRHAAAEDDAARDASPPWRTPRLYFGAFPREEMLALMDRPNSPLASLSPEARANIGVPLADITHVVDIAPWAAQKRAAIAAHRTQTGEGGPLANIPAEAIEWQLAREYFVHASLPWPSSPDDDDLIAAVAAERARA